MADKPPIVNLNSADRNDVGDGAAFAASVARLGGVLGMKKLGCSQVELAPGKRAWPHHLHYGQEELFIMLDGEATLRYDDQEHPLRQGDVFFAPPGPGTAHQIVNTSERPVRYLAISSMSSPELCYYPDSKKYGTYAVSREGEFTAFIAHEDSSVDYFDGEA